MIRKVKATRYVTPLREGGSLPAVVEADDDGMYVAKFRGAGHGEKALVAELVAGEIGRALGLLVPEIVLVDFDARLAAAEPDQEIRELLQRSSGINVGLDFLPGSLGFDPAAGFSPPSDLCAAVVWFDAFVTNVDRDARNTNMLVWHRRLWLIDHGSALYIHHTWKNAAAHARKPMAAIKSHVLLPFAGSILEADDRLAMRLTPEIFGSIIESVPDEWLVAQDGLPDPAAHRAAYLDYLTRRLTAHRRIAEEAERVRTGA
ncbi:MAG TPA: HipA family kinase [Terriglobales bacterium]|nr:HipA family kinase [Terriglobales bacterium]